MKNLFTFLVACVLGASGLTAQNVIFSDDFESGNFPNGYTLYDLDSNDIDTSIYNDIFDIKDSWQLLRAGDMAIGSASRFTSSGTANDWVVTPSISLTTNNYLIFSIRSGNPTFLDGFQLKLSTTTTDVDSFTVDLLTVSEVSASAWETYRIDLSAYDNETIYLAWVNNTTDGVILILDDILVTETLSRDVELTELDIPNKIEQNTSVNISGQYTYLGHETLNSIDINWRANGGAVKTVTKNGLNITYGQSMSFNHDSLFTTSAAGTYDTIDVWLSNPNGSTDPNHSNDSLQSILLNKIGGQAGVQRNVLFEEFTTAVCQYCPDGHRIMDQILDQYSNVIPVSVHSCFQTDAMTNQEALDLCATLGNGSAPSAMIDRFQHNGDAVPTHSRANNQWVNRTSARLQIPSSADITMTGSYDEQTREVVLDVDVEFVDYEYGDIRLSLMIIEDSLSGTGNGWAQFNAYYDVQGHPAYRRGTPFPPPNNDVSYINNYQHRHVLRDILPSTWGDASVIPNEITLNTTYSKSFNFTLNNTYKAKDVAFVAVVSYVGTDTDEYEVINAKRVPMFVLTSVDDVEAAATSTFNVYPNPSQNITNLELTLTETLPLEVSVFDITGKEVINRTYSELVKGTHTLPINVSALPNGFYIMKVKAGNEVMSKKISVNR